MADFHGPVMAASYCSGTGKMSYTTRKRAKKAGKVAFPGAHASAYPCGDHWHWGNLHPAVIAGKHTRAGEAADLPPRQASVHAQAAAAMRAIWAATHPQSTTS
jgi:hypothetical protein